MDKANKIILIFFCPTTTVMAPGENCWSRNHCRRFKFSNQLLGDSRSFFGCHGCVREGDGGALVESGRARGRRRGSERCVSGMTGCETHQLWTRC